MNGIIDFVRREPARVVGLVTATIALLAAFGVEITDVQVNAVTGFVGAALLMLGGAEIVRRSVTPNQTVVAKLEEERVRPVAGAAAPEVSDARPGDAVTVDPVDYSDGGVDDIDAPR